MSNINDNFFDGQYKDLWRALIPEQLTVKEVEFMLPYFNLQSGSKVLDIMCGYGRHAIALAEKGILVTAIDNLTEYIDEIKKTITERSLPVNAIKADAATYEADEIFDLVICMGNSLNFFSPSETERVLQNISTHLKPGGHLLINTWSLEEIATRSFKEHSSGEIRGVKIETTSRYLLQPNRIEAISTMTGADGQAETKTAVDYIFSVAEMETMLNKVGLVMKEVYSIPGRKKFTVGEPRAYIVAEKK
jgi:2-polyprenyl-3-methyl-5-hydroxy-6-metoxy-1,4-benzoquinol methylase